MNAMLETMSGLLEEATTELVATNDYDSRTFLLRGGSVIDSRSHKGIGRDEMTSFYEEVAQDAMRLGADAVVDTVILVRKHGENAPGLWSLFVVGASSNGEMEAMAAWFHRSPEGVLIVDDSQHPRHIPRDGFTVLHLEPFLRGWREAEQS